MPKANLRKPITMDNGEPAVATFPLIVSASRATDIPAFYADWFFQRLKKGYSAWINPFNGQKSYVGYADTKFIVFWSKDPRPLAPYLDYLKERGIGCYLHYTLNDYEHENLEPGVPHLMERISAFKEFVDKLGKGAVIWRSDPLILTDKIDIDVLLNKIGNIGEQLRGYVEKMIFSFADILPYRKVKRNLEKNHINYRDWTTDKMLEFAGSLKRLNQERDWNLQLACCGENIILPGVAQSRCIDDRLILRLCPHSQELREFLGAEIVQGPLQRNLMGKEIPEDAIGIGKNNRDSGQRKTCFCAKSKDIGQYNTCPHHCEYCYANASKEQASRNYRRHCENPLLDTITGVG